MNNRDEIEELAKAYAENENSSHTNDFYGFVNGFEACRDKVAETINNTPNDADLGRKLRSLFSEK